MGYLFKGLALLLVLALQRAGGSALEVIGLLAVTALWIYREKYLKSPLLMLVEFPLILLLSYFKPSFLILNSVLAFDLAAGGRYWYIAGLVPPAMFLRSGELMGAYAVLLALSAFSGHLCHIVRQKELSFRQVYDRERSIRYSLEEAKTRLLTTAREAAHLAETRERNRIARDIHDHVGHNLAAILLQLQVLQKLRGSNPAKAEALLQQSIGSLSQSLELLRDTVHNLKPREQPGLDYIRKLIDNFRFCPVQFSHSGNFDSLSPDHCAIITSVLKEALTNAARHSGATEMEINIEVRERIIRLYIRDNGLGCATIREGLGISGMRERVQNAGGTVSINSRNGFMIVCILPRDSSLGGEVFASPNRR